MKKYLISSSFILTLIIGCLFSFNAYAATPIDSAQVTLDATSFTYTGSAIKPVIKSVKLDTVDELENPVTIDLVQGKDYDVSYINNVNKGTGTVKLTGKGAYSGSVSKPFTITPYQMTGSAIKAVIKGRVTPKKTPTVVITFNGKTLKQGTDYKLEFSNLNNAGYKVGNVKITGMGNFAGTKNGNFNIYPTDVQNVKVTGVGQNNINLGWTAVSGQGIDGYKLYKGDANGNNATLLATVKSNSASIKNLNSSTVFNLFVVAYKTNGGETVKSNLSKVVTTCTIPGAATLNYCAKKNGKKIYANWKGVSRVTGYQIRYSIDKKYKNKNYLKYAYAKPEATGKTMKVQNTKVAHFIQVRAYKVYYSGGKKINVYGPWSVKMSTVFGRVLKQYSTTYVNNPNRTNNLRLACKAINGKVLKPGETFSFNGVVGKRTAAKGYKPAPIFTGATTHADGVGGGICQVASTMFNAALLANFKIVERHQHSQKVTYTPAGRDSAIYWGSENFRFKNNTKYPIKIKMTCANGKVTCQYLVSYTVKVPPVNLSVTRNGNHYTLKRTVNGKVNYTAYSTY